MKASGRSAWAPITHLQPPGLVLTRSLPSQDPRDPSTPAPAHKLPPFKPTLTQHLCPLTPAPLILHPSHWYSPHLKTERRKPEPLRVLQPAPFPTASRLSFPL